MSIRLGYGDSLNANRRSQSAHLLRSDDQVNDEAVGDLVLFKSFIVFQYLASEYQAESVVFGVKLLRDQGFQLEIGEMRRALVNSLVDYLYRLFKSIV